MQRRRKYVFPTADKNAWSVQSGYKKEFSSEELAECRDAVLPGYELGGRGFEMIRVFRIGS
jgi:hypothetical protein